MKQKVGNVRLGIKILLSILSQFVMTAPTKNEPAHFQKFKMIIVKALFEESIYHFREELKSKFH